jgi:urease accessory protein
MDDLTIIRHALPPREGREIVIQIKLLADRATLAKRRWRGRAEDGREFGFDLHDCLSGGLVFFRDKAGEYILEQTPEEVIEIPVTTVEQAARLAWGLGNLHFAVQVLPGALRVQEDPAVRQLLEREGLAYQRVTCVFLPLSSGPHHHHHDHHDHGHE